MRRAGDAAIRVSAFTLACAINVAFLCLWLYSRADPRAFPVEETATLAMVWLTDPQRPRARDDEPPPTAARRPEARAQQPVVVETPAAPESSTAITLTPERRVPPVDWYAEAAIVTRGRVIDEAPAKPQPSPGPGGEALVLQDDAGVPHKNGQVERREGGELITWISDLCYYSNRSTESLIGGPPTLKLPTCKVRSKRAREAEARAEALEKGAKPDYLAPPPPPPPPP